ncbi:MAG: Peptidase [Paenibacillus sp.]|nr:Peptidase [Paenibacillus sp.]
MKQMIKMSLVGTALSMTLLSGHSLAAGYTVQQGDSLWSVASANGITVNQLKAVNGLSSDLIYPNQQLQISTSSFPYTAGSSDTMWIISNKFGVPLQALIDTNPQLANPSNIWGGLQIHIPIVNATPVKPSLSFTNKLMSEGRFPLGKGTYEPFTNSFAVVRTWSPGEQTVRSHEGVDIAAAKGTPIYSASAGTIIRLGWNTYGGYRVTIQANDSTALYYAHMSGYASGLKLGGTVGAGQLLGYVGSTGYGPEGTEGQFEPHLHFGMYKTDASSWEAIDPFPYLQAWEQMLR